MSYSSKREPTVDGSYSNLALYFEAPIFGAMTLCSDGTGVSYQGDGVGPLPSDLESVQLTMKNGSDVLSVVSAVDEFSMNFFLG